ncbi:MAG: hypothetical protein QOH71_3719 [Blastocatellia bacterium]|jgi:hypothetical protein|nr:hypothetical protein [Blastocatellia bacterium]
MTQFRGLRELFQSSIQLLRFLPRALPWAKTGEHLRCYSEPSLTVGLVPVDRFNQADF